MNGDVVRGKSELSGGEYGDAGDYPDGNCADHAGAAVERGKAHRDACEERERIDREREQQPTKKTMPKAPRMRPMMIMAVVSATRVKRSRPTTSHGAGDIIAELVESRKRNWTADLAEA